MAKLTWEDRLKQAEKRGKFLQSDMNDVETWSHGVLADWKGYFQSDEDGAPFGKMLFNMDGDFVIAVCNNNIPAAKRTYNKLQTYIKYNIKRRQNPLTKSMSSKGGKNIKVTAAKIVTAKK